MPILSYLAKIVRARIDTTYLMVERHQELLRVPLYGDWRVLRSTDYAKLGLVHPQISDSDIYRPT